MKFKPYPNYKDSGIEWLGEIPKGWDIKKLKYLAKIKNGQDQKQVLIEEGGFPVYGSGGEFGRAYQYLYNQKSVLLGRKGTIDKPLFIQEPFWTVDTMYYTKIFSSVFPKFFFYQCLTIEFNYYQFGSTVPSMTQESLHNNYFAVPNFQDQATIANFLDRETLRIDALVEEKNHFIGLLKEKRQTLISHVVTKGLDPTVKMKDSGIDWLGEVPEHWVVQPVKYVIDKIESGTSVNATAESAKDNEIGVLKTSCVYSGQFNPFENKAVVEQEIDRVSCPLKIGMLIVSRMNTPDLVGAAGLVTSAPTNLYLPDRLWQISFLNANSTYVYYWTQSTMYRAFIKSVCSGTSSSMQNLSQDQFKSFIFPSPENEEQTKIANFLDHQTAKIDALIAETQQSIALLKEHRTALISAVVTGKIDVREVA